MSPDRCRTCGKRLVRPDTDGNGRLVLVETPCACPPRVPERREWPRHVDVERRRACICQRCDRPTEGKPRVALYCAEHRAEAHADAQAKHKAKVGDKHVRAYRQRHRARINRKARTYARKHRKERAEYKREWRRKNRDKVRAQKRRSALRGRTAEQQRRRREKVAAGLVPPPQPTRRNERGERLCVRDGCQSVMRGRAKMCGRCKAMDAQRPMSEAAA